MFICSLYSTITGMNFRNVSLCILLILLFNVSYAEWGKIGILRTERETYPNELGYSSNIEEMLQGLGADTILVDYNAIVRQEGTLESKVRTFIHNNNINKVIIPGNYYNLDSEPFPPTTYRQDVTEMLVKIADEQKIRLMGICGGLQGIVHAKGIKMVEVKSISNGNAKQHLISHPNPHSQNALLHEIRINPSSKLGVIVGEHVDLNENGWINLYLPDLHSRVINNSMENISKLNAAGYKIVGFSADGMIEIIEDEVGNVHFQGHPEGLLIGRDTTGSEISSLRNASTNAVLAVFKDFINS